MLKISKMTDYAIRVMVELSRQGEILSAQALAERVGVETPTASKVLKLLAGKGLLESYRGASGGYRVKREAKDISVAEVIEAIEGPVAITECSDEAGHCDLESHCGLQGNWRRISREVSRALRGVTLAEMASPAAAGRGPLDLRTL
jgi:FeS assembly SUF system regulator